MVRIRLTETESGTYVIKYVFHLRKITDDVSYINLWSRSAVRKTVFIKLQCCYIRFNPGQNTFR
jgi:hypothetical protein